MQVQAILDDKNMQGIIRVKPDDNVYEALQVMGRHNIGAVVVVENRALCGIFSERDYARKGIIFGRKAKTTPVSEVMTANVFTVQASTTIEECMELFRTKRIRHLPVLDDSGAIVGMLSIGDIVSALMRSQRRHINFLEEYISGKV